MTERTDVVVIGAGPVGTVTAIAQARAGKRVLLLEANTEASRRLAGEWLHPPGKEILDELGIDVGSLGFAHKLGRGFVVFPDDGSDEITLPYAAGLGISCEHHLLAENLREVAKSYDTITFLSDARAMRIDGQRVAYQVRGQDPEEIEADLIVGADGRSSIVRKSLGLPAGSTPVSRMAGILVRDIDMPHEAFGHVILGGPGPILAYRLNQDEVRMCIDVPLTAPTGPSAAAYLWDHYAPVVPVGMRQAFRRSLGEGNILWASNQVRLRTDYGRDGLVLVGDAAGHSHPLTAIGMTQGFMDAIELARARDFARFANRRRAQTRVPSLLAVLLYDAVREQTFDAAAIRASMYRLWRSDEHERVRTMQYLACQDMALGHFWKSFAKVSLASVVREVRRAAIGLDPEYAEAWLSDFAGRLPWLGRAMLKQFPTSALTRQLPEAAEVTVGASSPSHESPEAASAQETLGRGVTHLAQQQESDGSWEGEVVWCAMLTAQLVIMRHLIGKPLTGELKARALKQFEVMRLGDGTWGLHADSKSYLYVTTLVYVAARLLGVGVDNPLLEGARKMFQREGGVAAVPSWGKFWLAMVGLYDWRGVSPVLPELWRLPESLPAHPRNFYCHTRLIYMGMASIYGRRFTAPESAIIGELRQELYPRGYKNVDWKAARSALRQEEVIEPPSKVLNAAMRAQGWVDKLHNKKGRAKILAELSDRIRFDLQTTDYSCLSPVSGMLGLIALWLDNPRDPHFERGFAQLAGWFWQDDREGLRVAGARSITWDTSFALQALARAQANGQKGGSAAFDRGISFLRTQQMRCDNPVPYQRNDRVDPDGGFCFAGVGHGWPVSDCTAEAMIALTSSNIPLDTEAATRAVRFILRCQNADGGFGSYEAKRQNVSLEFLNPAEMFGDSMTEHSYVECTASCIAALRTMRKRYPYQLTAQVDEALAKAVAHVRQLQRADGSWPGNWGVNFIYGTMFGIRGLVQGGVSPRDPAVQRASKWLLDRQHDDGGFGESGEGYWKDRYIDQPTSQVIQTSWALIGLAEAKCGDFGAMSRAAAFLARTQDQATGAWPSQDWAGVFFKSALLDYRLYKSYFPVWALAEYENLRQSRLVGDAAPVGRRRRSARPGEQAEA